MNVLTVFAHSGSQSFCYAVLERFDAGLRAAGHANEEVDLHAIDVGRHHGGARAEERPVPRHGGRGQVSPLEA
jgi:putative NADPH-quinone reductase